MAATNFWRITLKGEIPADAARTMLPEGALDVLRVDTRKGNTVVFFSAAKLPTARKGPAAAQKVSLRTVTKIGA